MLVANAVVDTDQPRLQVGENQMDDAAGIARQPLDHHTRQQRSAHSRAYRGQLAAPIVSNDQRSRRDGALDEPTERLGATVEHDGEPNASGIASVFPVVELGARLSMTHLDGTGDGNLVVNTTASSPRVRPPTQVSSTSTWFLGCPRILSWLGRTMPERSLRRI